MVQILSVQNLLWALCLLVISLSLRRQRSLNGLPSAGRPWPLFPSLESLFRGKQILYQAYRKQLLDNKPYILHGIFGDSILLPPSMLPWLQSRPESLLSAKWAQMDALNIPETFLRPDIGLNPVHEPLVRRELTARLDHVAGVIWDEAGLALKEVWGTETESWREINLDYTVRRVIARATNRIFVGDDLCHNNDFIEDSIQYVTLVSTCGLLLNLFPPWLKKSLAIVFVTPIKITYSRCSKHLLPIFSDLVHGRLLPSPHLFSSWLVSNSESYPPSSAERTPDFLSRRIMALNFAAIHTSTLTACNLLLDVFSQPSAESLLRDECLASSERWTDTWNRARLNQMQRLDSALRESLRLWGLVPKAMSRKVVHPDGVLLPNGQHLPTGATVCISGWGLHHDEAVYSAPFEFVPERFLRTPTDGSEGRCSEVGQAAAGETDPQFAAWGIGKHACPGRFFAVDLVKVIVARVLMEYEVKPLSRRPENTWIEYNVIPPPTATLSIRRSKSKVARS